jgi:hypothetical protein
LGFLARTIRHEEEMKGMQIRKDKVKISLFADDMILHLKDLKTPLKNQCAKISILPMNQ